MRETFTDTGRDTASAKLEDIMTKAAKPKSGLTPTQQNIIDKMKAGWELGISRSILDSSKRCWLQEGGLGKGGKSEKVSLGTFNALAARGVVTIAATDQSRVRYELDMAHPDLEA